MTSPGPLAAFLANPTGTPQEIVDRLIARAHRFDDATLEALNVALARRAGLDPDEVHDSAAAFDRPPEPPIRL